VTIGAEGGDAVPVGGSGVVIGSSVENVVVDEAVTNKAILVYLQRSCVSQDFHNTQREKNEKSSMSVRICRLEQYAQVIENTECFKPHICMHAHAC
jgi:FlaA1/EpsC-like NDP-sugar epimerase